MVQSLLRVRHSLERMIHRNNHSLFAAIVLMVLFKFTLLITNAQDCRRNFQIGRS